MAAFTFRTCPCNPLAVHAHPIEPAPTPEAVERMARALEILLRHFNVQPDGTILYRFADGPKAWAPGDEPPGFRLLGMDLSEARAALAALRKRA